MPATRSILQRAVAGAVVALGLVPAAHAAETAAAAPAATGVEQVLVALLAVVGLCVAIAFSVLLVRVILPGLASVADRSLARLGTLRLFTQGLLPLVGSGLIISGASQALGPQVGGLLGLVLGLPLLLAVLVGLLAAIPHVGGQVLSGGEERSPLARHLGGAIVVGFPMLLWPLLPHVALVVSLLVAGWCAGVGLHTVLGARSPRSASSAVAQP